MKSIMMFWPFLAATLTPTASTQKVFAEFDSPFGIFLPDYRGNQVPENFTEIYSVAPRIITPLDNARVLPLKNDDHFLKDTKEPELKYVVEVVRHGARAPFTNHPRFTRT